jgi:hypothetical protein
VFIFVRLLLHKPEERTTVASLIVALEEEEEEEEVLANERVIAFRVVAAAARFIFCDGTTTTESAINKCDVRLFTRAHFFSFLMPKSQKFPLKFQSLPPRLASKKTGWEREQT